MAVTTQVTHDELIVTLTGIDAMWALKRQLVINRQHVVSAQVMGRKAAIKLLRFRLWGSYLPGVVCAGTFSVSKKAGLPPGSRAFMSINRAKEILVVTTSLARPRLIGLQVANPTAVASILIS